MRVVVQRVSSASVAVGGQTVGVIGAGLLVLAGFAADDGDEQRAQEEAPELFAGLADELKAAMVAKTAAKG